MPISDQHLCRGEWGSPIAGKLSRFPLLPQIVSSSLIRECEEFENEQGAATGANLDNHGLFTAQTAVIACYNLRRCQILPLSKYIHELSEWPQFRWSNEELVDDLSLVRYQQGRLIGSMESIGFDFRQQAILQNLTREVVKTCEIEGENLNAEHVRSSLARRLGLDVGGLRHPDRQVEGIVEMMLDATHGYDQPLTAERILAWHASLFPTGRSGLRRIRAGTWRDDAKGPMQVVSGPIGRERVHFEAPPAVRLDNEIALFLNWFESGTGTDGVLKAALAHLWFVTIHPLDDGNGRVARALAEMMLARSEETSQRFYSLSDQIRKDRSAYYEVLERTQKGNLEVTVWLRWFLNCLRRAIASAQDTLAAVVWKARFWESVKGVPLNSRQRMMLNRLLDGFRGKLTTSKWAKIAKCSDDSALRDINGLLKHRVLLRSRAGGRSTSYELARDASQLR